MELLSIFPPLFLAYSVMLLQRSLGMMGETVRLLIFVNFLYRLTSLDSEHPLVDRERTQPCIAVLQHLLKKIFAPQQRYRCPYVRLQQSVATQDIPQCFTPYRSLSFPRRRHRLLLPVALYPPSAGSVRKPAPQTPAEGPL